MDVLAGDFNVIANPSESSDCNGSQVATGDMRDFREWMQELAVFDHPFIGPLFTWSNHTLCRKLNRVLINHSWLTYFKNFTVEFMAPEVSDHCPAIVRLDVPRQSLPKPFKFFNFWTKNDAFMSIVSESWKVPAKGNPMSIIHLKLKRLKIVLKNLNKSYYGKISERVHDKRIEVGNAQIAMLANPRNGEMVKLERKLSKELQELLKDEESFINKNLE